MTVNVFVNLMWILAIIISVAMFWVRNHNVRAWLYVILGSVGCIVFGCELLVLHQTFDVFIAGTYIVLNTYFWIKTRELIEKEKLAKEMR